MANRRLTRRVLSRASGRAESTINQLLAGAIKPTAEILQDIAPALQSWLTSWSSLGYRWNPTPVGGAPGRRLSRSAGWWPQPRG
jgi:transcriptional regulator with XRE-family HTH domain